MFPFTHLCYTIFVEAVNQHSDYQLFAKDFFSSVSTSGLCNWQYEKGPVLLNGSSGGRCVLKETGCVPPTHVDWTMRAGCVPLPGLRDSGKNNEV